MEEILRLILKFGQKIEFRNLDENYHHKIYFHPQYFCPQLVIYPYDNWIIKKSIRVSLFWFSMTFDISQNLSFFLQFSKNFKGKCKTNYEKIKIILKDCGFYIGPCDYLACFNLIVGVTIVQQNFITAGFDRKWGVFKLVAAGPPTDIFRYFSPWIPRPGYVSLDIVTASAAQYPLWKKIRYTFFPA